LLNIIFERRKGMSKEKIDEDIVKEMYRIYAVIWLLDNIVFCENCHYAVHPNDHPTMFACSQSNWLKEEEDFCSKGMKKDGEER